MMKILLTFLVCFPLQILAQTIPSIPFTKVLDQASREKKIFMALLYSRECVQCNEVADKGLGTDIVRSRMAKNEFLLFAYPANSKDRELIADKYEVPADAMALLFISPDGVLLNKMMGSTTLGQSYVAQMEKAIRNAEDEKGMAEFEKAYASGSKNPALLSQLLVYREQFGKETDGLLDDLVRSLPADSLNSLTQLQTIARHAPVLQSHADSILRRNGDRFNEAWYRMSLQERSAINGRIINKTKAKAIRNKDRNLAMRAASFAASVANEPFRSNRNYSWTLMDYSMATGDTASYIRYASRLMDGTYMHISPDSIRRVDSLSKQKMIDNLKPSGEGRVSFTFSPSTQYYANDMNQVAFTIYRISDSIPLLQKACNWSKRSLEFQESSASLDTYARLLYKTGQKDSAIAYQRKAIDANKKRGFSSPEFEKVLSRMIANEAKLE